LLSGNPKPDIFDKILMKEADKIPKEGALADKLIKAYAKMKLKAGGRNQKLKICRTQWKPSLQELV
jgi:hypothetical protein